MEFFFEKSHNAGKNRKGDHLGFFKIHSVQKHQKIEGGTFRWKKNFSKKSLTEPKILLALLSFLNDIKILLPKLRIVRL